VSALLLPRGRALAQALDEDIPRFAAAGVTHLRVQVSMFVGDRAELPEFVGDLVRRVATY
jgi:hypothetical protein